MYIPEILEGEARGRLRRLYHNVKTTLHVPVVNYLFRTLAFYPSFLNYALEASRPNLLSLTFETLSDELRALPPPHLTASPLGTVSARDLRGAASMLPVFRYANAKLLLLCAAWYEVLSERPIQHTNGAVEDVYIPPGISRYFPQKVPMIQIETAPASMQHLLRDIVNTHRSFGPASDYRALACYPTFLTAAWSSIRPLVHTDAYQKASRQLLLRAETLAHGLPYSLPLSPGRLVLLMSEREIASCTGIVAMFRDLLPSLILDVELMTRLLEQKMQQ